VREKSERRLETLISWSLLAGAAYYASIELANECIDRAGSFASSIDA
jgi:hypothetical protein